MSFAKRIATERGLTLYFISSTAGMKFYAFVIIPSIKSEEFEDALNFDFNAISKHGSLVYFRLGECEASEEINREVQNYIKFLNQS